MNEIKLLLRCLSGGALTEEHNSVVDDYLSEGGGDSVIMMVVRCHMEKTL